MSDSSDKNFKQTQIGNYFTRQSKAKEKEEKDDTPKNFIDRRTRFKDKSNDWTSGWSTSWSNSSSTGTSNWFSTDWKNKDTEDYRNEYPGKKDDLNQSDNLKFYMNELKSNPDGDFIENIHRKWWGNYMFLERHQGYIQWLFPIRESGRNPNAQELQLHEATKIKEDPKAYRRVMKSYKMMLDFYGMKIKDEDTGEIEKAKNWKERFNHLNRSSDNYLRITRILKCLGELGYEHIKVRFLEFVIEEALEKKTLKNCYKSCKDYWVETLRNDAESKHIHDYMKKVEEGYESDGDPLDEYKAYYGQSEEVEITDESQEMKYYDAEKGSELQHLKNSFAFLGQKLPAAAKAENTLIESVANIELKSHEGKTPLDFENDDMDRHFMKTSPLAKKTKSKTLATSGKGILAPSNWADMSFGNVLKVSIISSSGRMMQIEWDNVKMEFEKTLPQARIISIHRMQNMYLWEQYYLKRKQLEHYYGNGCSNELSLFHGTTPDIVDVIAVQNFDTRLSGNRVGAMFGQGTYFAIDANYSDLYAKADSNGHKFMFLVKVLAGKTCTGQPEYRRPPPQYPSSKHSPLFDSCVDNVNSPRIYCIFHDSQYYPEHLIEYT